MNLFNPDEVNIVRRFYHYKYWEDHSGGMYNPVPSANEEEMVTNSVTLLSTPDRLESFMMRAINEWVVSTDQNLSNLSCNRRAWLGQAACFIAHKCPSYLTGRAWFMLSDNQRHLANECADRVISIYESEYNERNAKNILR